MGSRTVLAALVALVVVIADGGASEASDPGIPTSLPVYRLWEKLTREPQLVPYELAIQCATVTEAQLVRARKSHGPHTFRWINVYANPIAMATLRDKTATEFPRGAIIAKEKLRNPGDVYADGVGGCPIVC